MLSESTPNDQLHRRYTRRGASLVDVALGAALLSLLLIPAIKLMGESRLTMARCQLHDVLLFEAERALETQKIELATRVDFDAFVFDSSLNLKRLPDIDKEVEDNGLRAIRKRIEPSVDLSIYESGLPDTALLTLTVTVYEDANGNARFDNTENASEEFEVLRTQWSRPE